VQYSVVQDDTLWGIAVKFGLSLDELIAANPSIDPDRLFPGDVLIIPVPGFIDLSQATRVPAPAAGEMAGDGAAAHVAASGGGLRLRKSPDTAARIITKLAALTPLRVLGKTVEGGWLNVALADNTTGWVMSRYVDLTGAGDVPVLAASNVVGQDSPPAAKMGGANSEPIPIPLDTPYISGITTRARQIFAGGQARGNRANVFALVGDSNTATPYFFEPIDRGNYQLGDYGYLEDTIRFFRGSFRVDTVAAVVGYHTGNVLDPGSLDGNGQPNPNAGECAASESPLACEYRRKRPSVALILLGTNDCYGWRSFEGQYRRVVEYTIEHGIIPVLITKADDLEAQRSGAPSGYINSVIARLSREYDVPLLDLRTALSNTPNHGLGEDGYHYNAPPDGQSTNFSGDHLNYGFTMRNLTALQVLDAVRRTVLAP
jgi:LysM repeat protein